MVAFVTLVAASLLLVGGVAGYIMGYHRGMDVANELNGSDN